MDQARGPRWAKGIGGLGTLGTRLQGGVFGTIPLEIILNMGL